MRGCCRCSLDPHPWPSPIARLRLTTARQRWGEGDYYWVGVSQGGALRLARPGLRDDGPLGLLAFAHGFGVGLFQLREGGPWGLLAIGHSVPRALPVNNSRAAQAQYV